MYFHISFSRMIMCSPVLNMQTLLPEAKVQRTEYIPGRVEIGRVYLPSQLERAPQLCR